MNKKLNGMLNLSRIPKNLIKKNKNGESVIWIDVMANKNGADPYGNTHSISVYDKDARKATYLANLKEQSFGGENIGQTLAQNNAPEGEDLPW